MTAPGPGSQGAVSFLVTADTRTDAEAHALVVSRMLEHQADLLVVAGDLVGSGDVESYWKVFFGIEAPVVRDTPIVAAVGNHEVVGGAVAAAWSRLFSTPHVASTQQRQASQRLQALRQEGPRLVGRQEEAAAHADRIGRRRSLGDERKERQQRRGLDFPELASEHGRR